MLSFDDEKNSLAEALDKYSVGVPPVQWLPWIPQLLACLVQYDGNVILNLLSHVSVARLYGVTFCCITIIILLGFGTPE